MISFYFNRSLKVLSLLTLIFGGTSWGIRTSTYEFGGTPFSS